MTEDYPDVVHCVHPNNKAYKCKLFSGWGVLSRWKCPKCNNVIQVNNAKDDAIEQSELFNLMLEYNEKSRG